MKTAKATLRGTDTIVTKFETFKIVSINDHNKDKLAELPDEFLAGLSRVEVGKDEFYTSLGTDMFPNDDDVICIVELIDETEESVAIKAELPHLLNTMKAERKREEQISSLVTVLS